MSWPVPGDPPRLWAESNILLWFFLGKTYNSALPPLQGRSQGSAPLWTASAPAVVCFEFYREKIKTRFNKNVGHKLGQVKLNKHDLKIRFLDWADGQGTGYHNSDNFLFKLITLERALRSHHQVPKFKFLDTQTAFALCLWVSERVSAVQLSRPSLKLKIRVTLCPFKYPKYWLF